MQEAKRRVSDVLPPPCGGAFAPPGGCAAATVSAGSAAGVIRPKWLTDPAGRDSQHSRKSFVFNAWAASSTGRAADS